MREPRDDWPARGAEIRREIAAAGRQPWSNAAVLWVLIDNPLPMKGSTPSAMLKPGNDSAMEYHFPVWRSPLPRLSYCSSIDVTLGGFISEIASRPFPLFSLVDILRTRFSGSHRGFTSRRSLLARSEPVLFGLPIASPRRLCPSSLGGISS